MNSNITEAIATLSPKQQYALWATSDLAMQRETVLAIVPHITGGLSMLGSIATIYQIFKHLQSKGNLKSYHFIMLLMASVDFIASFCYALSTFPVPYEQLQYTPLRPERYGAVGNPATCKAQGFGIQFGITVLFLNLLLTMHYVAVIRYRMPERYLIRRVQGGLALALLAGMAFSVPFLFVDGYNFMHCLPSWCWIAPNPQHCAMDRSMPQCQNQAKLWRNIAYFAPMWTSVILIALGQAIIFWTVRKAQLKAMKWRNSYSNEDQKLQQQKLKRRADSYQKVGRQSFFYLCSMLLCWLPMTIASNLLHDRRIWFLTNDKFYLPLLVVTVQPLQGFLNFIVYNHACIHKQVAVQWARLKAVVCCSRKRPEPKPICPPRDPHDLIMMGDNSKKDHSHTLRSSTITEEENVAEVEEKNGEEDLIILELESMYDP